MRTLKRVTLNRGFWVMDLVRNSIENKTDEVIKCVGFETAKKYCREYLEEDHLCAVNIKTITNNRPAKFYLACSGYDPERRTVSISYVYEDNADNYFAGSFNVPINGLFKTFVNRGIPPRVIAVLTIATDVTFVYFLDIFRELIQKQIIDKKDI